MTSDTHSDMSTMPHRECRYTNGMVIRGSRILSNTAESPLSKSLGDLLSGATDVKLAVGYLFVEGLAPMLPALEKLERSRLLIGNVVNRLPEEQIRLEQVSKPTAAVGDEATSFARSLRDDRNRNAALTALNLRQTIDGLPRTPTIDDTLLSLAALIAEGKLEVRLYTAGRLHAKVALVSYPEGDERAPGAAIVGSSNLTLPVERAVYDANCDLDVLLDGEENFNALSGWFETHWSDGQDFRKELFEELARRWPDGATPP